MKAISLWQPWASAMAAGVKRNETRSWSTDYRGELLICSAKRMPSREELAAMDVETYKAAMAMPYGFGLCVVDLLRCVRTERVEYYRPLSEAERSLGDYTPGRFAWITDNCRKLRNPVPIRGRQGLFSLTPDEEEKVRREMV